LLVEPSSFRAINSQARAITESCAVTGACNYGRVARAVVTEHVQLQRSLVRLTLLRFVWLSLPPSHVLVPFLFPFPFPF